MKKLLMLLLASLSLVTSAAASEYPGDYGVWSDSQQADTMLIQRDLQYSGAVALDIEYKGPLAKEGNDVSVFVRIHYRDGDREALFPMTGTESIRFARVTNGCLKGVLGGCAADGTPEMKRLLQWAARMPMALNALDIEIAFTDGKGNWDSRGGANYVFHFKDFQL